MTRRSCWLMAMALIIGMVGLSFAPAWAAKVKAEKGEAYDPAIAPADFEDGGGQPLPINNRSWPLVPGTTFVYEGETEDGTERNEVYVTHLTKDILGVTCTVVLDRAWVDGELAEETFDWHAQDTTGNVWYFGEDSKEYEDGEVVSTEGSWEAGVGGAKPGIVMLADPHPGDTYRQEYWAGVAEDMGKVLKLNASASVPYGDYNDCLKTKEWTPLEKGVVEHKYYAPGTGLVLVTELKGKSVRVELVDITTE